MNVNHVKQFTIFSQNIDNELCTNITEQFGIYYIIYLLNAKFGKSLQVIPVINRMANVIQYVLIKLNSYC